MLSKKFKTKLKKTVINTMLAVSAVMVLFGMCINFDGVVNKIKENIVSSNVDAPIKATSAESYTINNQTLHYNKIVYVGAGEEFTTVRQALDYLCDNNYKEDAAIVLRAGSYNLDNIFCGESYNIDPKFNTMDVAFIADKPGQVYSTIGEIQQSENNRSYYMSLQFYGIIFKNSVYGHAAHLNGDTGLNEYYNCVFECPVGGWNGNVSNTSVRMENCVFKGGPNTTYYAANPVTGLAINCASTDTTIEPCNGTKTTCLTNVTLDSNYHIKSALGETNRDFFIHTGTGINPDGTQANIGVYGGKFAWAGYEQRENRQIIAVGTSEQIDIIGSGANLNKTFNPSEWTFSSNSTAIATIGTDGKITGVSAGSCVITAYNASENITVKANIEIWSEIFRYQINKEILKFKRIVTIGPGETYTTLKQGFDYLCDNNYKTDVAVVLKAGQYTFQDINTGYSTNINGKYNQMNISIIAADAGRVKVNPSEMGVIEVNRSYSITLKFYRIIFNNSYGNFHTNMEGAIKQYYNCVFETSYGGYNGIVGNTSVLMENCLFMVDGNSGYYTKYPVTGYAINTASRTTHMEPYNGQKVNCIYNTQFDSSYYIKEDNPYDWKHAGVAYNPDRTIANIGVYGGRYAWQGFKIQADDEHVNVNETMKANIVSYWEDDLTDYDETEWDWVSSDTDIAVIDSDGTIHGISDGNVTITATNRATGMVVVAKIEVWGSIEEYRINNETLQFRKIVWVGPTRKHKTIQEAFEFLYNRGIKTNCAIVLDEGQHSMQGIQTGTSSNINPKYSGMEVSIIGDDPGSVKLIPGEFGMTECGSQYGIALKFYRVIFNNRVEYFHLNMDKQMKEYYNCVFETPYAGWNGVVSTAKVYMENCTFNTTYDTAFTAQGIGGQVINSASINQNVGALNATKTACLTDVTLNSKYEIMSDDYIDAGEGEDPDGSKADIGVYGGRYAWIPESKYESQQRNEYIKAGDTLKIEINDIRGFELDVDESEWTWVSSDTQIASVEAGTVTAKKLGTAMITASKQMANKTVYIKVLVHVYNDKPGAVTVPQVEQGNNFTIVLKEDGTVWASGYNERGQLGQGNQRSYKAPVQVKIDEHTYLTNVKKIDVAHSAVVALTTDGRVYAWGYNNVGMLGQGNTTDLSYATPLKGEGGVDYLTDIIDVDIEFGNIYAIDSNGNLYGTGRNIELLGNNTSYTPIKLDKMSNLIMITSGTSAPMAMQNNGDTYSWGENCYGEIGVAGRQSNPIFVANGLIDIKGGGYTNYYLKEDGTVWASGYNNCGQLGVGNTTNNTGFIQMKYEDGTNVEATKISAGGRNFIFKATDGKLYITGYNGYGQFSNGTTTNSTYPTVMKYDAETDISDALFMESDEIWPSDNSTNTAIIRTEGSVWVAGRNNNGQIGNGEMTDDNSVYLKQFGYKYLNYQKDDIVIRVGENYNINKNNFKAYEFNVFMDAEIKNAGNLRFSTEDTNITLSSTGKVTGLQEGYAKVKVEDTENNAETYIIVKVVNDQSMALEIGNKFSVGLTTSGQVWTWGSNIYGELGLGTSKLYENEPVQIKTLSDIVDIGAGNYHAIALDNTGNVYTWGLNNAGQLGDGTTSAQSTPQQISGLSNIIKVDAYKNITTALDKDGNLYVWGEGYSDTPRIVETNVLDMSEDVIMTKDRRVRRINEFEDISVSKNAVKISGMNGNILVLEADGTIKSIDSNNTDTAIQVEDAVDVSIGNGFVYILDKNGDVYTYGSATNGELGNGTNTAVAGPTKVELSNIELISAGEGQVGGVADFGGYMFITGQNDYGQLGQGDLTPRNKFEIILNVGLNSNVDKVVEGIGESEIVNIGLGINLNLKKDLEEDSTSEITIVDDTIATLTKNLDGSYTVTGKAIGRTFLNASVVGIIRGEEAHCATNVEVRIVPEGGITVPQIKSGDDFTIALKANGEIESWGKNSFGQLGIGNTDNYDEPQLVDNIQETIVEIAVGDNHVLALTEAGKIYGWGLNNLGQVGNGTTANQLTKATVISIDGNELSKIIRVEAHGDNSFAINEDGDVFAWGKDFGNKAKKLENLENVIDVSTSYFVKADGTVYNMKTLDKLIIVGKVRSIDEGTNHTVFLTTEGKAFAIGSNDYGQLGNGSTDISSDGAVAVRRNASTIFDNIVAVEAGDRYTMLLTSAGEVYSAGLNENGRLGISKETINVLTPVNNENIADVLLISAGNNHSVVAKTDGTVYAWGKGDLGSIGNRRTKDTIIPEMVGPYIIRTNEKHITLGKTDEFILKAKTDYFNIISEPKIPTTALSKNTQVARISTLDDTYLTVDEISEGYSAYKVEGVKEGTTNIVLTEDKTNSNGVVQLEVLPVAGTTISPMVETNSDYTITLKTNGTVWTYGNNSYGQLGTGDLTNYDEPQQVIFGDSGNSVGDESQVVKIKQISIGEFHSAALDTEGNVWTWGRNNYNQLGNSNGAYSVSPVKVTGIPKVTRIASGSNSIMAITENNRLVVWGQNAYGELGTGKYTNKTLPTDVNGMHDVLDIQGGKNHYLILKTTGELFTIGSNLYNQLGLDLGERTRTNSFEKIDINPKFGFISANQSSNVAITVDGAPYIWGQNSLGNLGGSETKISQPTQIQGLTGIVEADVGKTNTILRDYNNNIYIVGQNKYGQIGDGTNNSVSTYNVSTAIDDVLRVSTGNTYTAVMRKDGTVWAWGDYNHGSKILKSRTNSKVPVQIGSDTSSLDQLEIIIKKSEIASILANSQFMFNLIYEDQNSTSNFIYQSLNTDIATVNEDGNILGVREGSTWVKVIDTETGKVNVAIVRVIDNVEGYNVYAAPKIRTGENFAVSLKEDGNINLWGYDASQMVDSDLPYTLNVVETYLNIDSGKNHIVVLRNNGTVWTSGDNSYGQLGIGTNATNTKLIQIQGLTDIEKIAAGDNFGVAMDSYGILYAWGEGYGNSPKVIDTNIRNASYLSAGGRDQIVLVLPSGEIYGFGSILNGVLDGIENAVKVEVGDDYLLILDTNGDVYIYRNNTLAKESTVSKAIDISVAGNTKMYQNVNEKAYAWGDNTYGQLGLDNLTLVNVPTQPVNNGNNVFTIGAGNKNTYIVDTQGFVYSAGDNSLGQCR